MPGIDMGFKPANRLTVPGVRSILGPASCRLVRGNAEGSRYKMWVPCQQELEVDGPRKHPVSSVRPNFCSSPHSRLLSEAKAAIQISPT